MKKSTSIAVYGAGVLALAGIATIKHVEHGSFNPGHTPAITAKCDSPLTVSATNYDAGSHVKVQYPVGTTVLDVDFTNLPEHSFTASLPAKYSVQFTSPGDPTGKNGWTKLFTGTIDHCVVVTIPGTSPATAPSTTASTVASTTTTASTVASTIADTEPDTTVASTVAATTTTASTEPNTTAASTQPGVTVKPPVVHDKQPVVLPATR